ncbi:MULTISPECIES: amidase [unclassified Variovorax]|uniref:amidase n=1 Tax=unclassified Variovorax TaxID=663243 RepID=UPI000839ABB6|nr:MULTISPECIES: amidase [unclassified Variovorax]PNG59967.1 Glutamyl-tRNA(Gln) amidotransferase subunit A [Variovorax sp. B4]PNG60241.1 Glutamyl-tRNA(Gln) amidotransferase subunit A [Variovorax sp. B2]VTV13925.1 Glutamyl-tRNA(Gln) amidotransferase subunit A [Variovorax sp. WDL1]
MVSLHSPRAAPSLRQSLDDLDAGRISASELVRDTLRRADDTQRRLNAFATIPRERAMAAALASDRRYAEGTQRPLEGLPIGVKDLIDTRGIETRYGSPAFIGNIPSADAAVVRMLVQQGAIVVGKTTTHEFAWGVTTASAAFGDTLHPLDARRIPGGSSGGAAVAIADGVMAAGLGTDTGGSVRIPAALCGVAGFKPTHGALPTQGVFPLAASLDHPGLLGASVGDVSILADALGIVGSSGAADELDDARVGVICGIASLPPASDVACAFAVAADALASALPLEELNAGDLFSGSFDAFARIVLAEGGLVHFGRRDSDWIAAHYGAETVERLTHARATRVEDYALAQQARRKFAAGLQRLMARHRFLVLPATPCTAPLVGQTRLAIGGWTGSVREALMTYTAPFNLAGCPAVSIPLRRRPGALPVGLQVVGRPGEDAALLRIARRMERLLHPPHRSACLPCQTDREWSTCPPHREGEM